MAGSMPSWAQVVTSRVKLSTPYKETYRRRGPDPWVRLFQLESRVNELTQAHSLLVQENKELKGRLSAIEDMAAQEVDIKEEIAKEVIEECISKPDKRLLSFLQAAVAEDGGRGKCNGDHFRNEEAIQEKIQASLAEERERMDRALNIRFGGLEKEALERWHKQKGDRVDLFVRHFQDSYDIRIEGITKINLMGPQVVLTIGSKQDRIDILRQAHKLRGSKTWMAEDLTKDQLSRKKEELQKVKQARSEGYWARYMNGEAVIRKFKVSGKAR